MRPLRAFGPSVADTIGPMAYRDRQTTSDANYPEGRQHYWKSRMLADLSDGAIEALLAFAAERPSGDTSHGAIALQHLHGAAARVDPAATAFPHRRDQFDFLILSQWADPVDAEPGTTWTRDFFAAMQPFTERAVYVNGLGEGEEARVGEAYGANYPRLSAIKARYDPDNLFRANQNILPMKDV